LAWLGQAGLGKAGRAGEWKGAARRGEVFTQQEGTMKTETGRITAALARAQGSFRKIKKTSRGEGFAYASLADHLEAIRRPLAMNGLALRLPTRVTLSTAAGTTVAIATVRLDHGESGESLESPEFEMPIATWEPTAIAAACALAQRCALLGFLAIRAVDEDESAVARETTAPPRETKAAPSTAANEAPKSDPTPAVAVPVAELRVEPTEEERNAQARAMFHEARVRQVVQNSRDLGVGSEGFRAWAEEKLGHPYVDLLSIPEGDLETLETAVRAMREAKLAQMPKEEPAPKRRRKTAPVPDDLPPRPPLLVMDYQDDKPTAPAQG
jgi:ERF superfamily